MIPLFISSKNRASQLRLLFESLHKNSADLFEITVLFAATNEDYTLGYNKLIEEEIIPDVQWLPEGQCSTPGLFTEQFYHYLKENNNIFALMVDDNLLYRKIEMTEDRIQEILDDETFCFSFRLGENTIVQNHLTRETQQPLDDSDIKEDHAKWSYVDRSDQFEDYAIPFSWDGVIYRTKDVLDAFDGTDFTITDHTWAPLPHRTEAYMYQNMEKISHKPMMASSKHSLIVGMDYNKVINVQSSGGAKFRADEKGLNDLYLKGFVIDLDSMNFSEMESSHEEVPFKLRKM